jgi:hypothetical protein
MAKTENQIALIAPTAELLENVLAAVRMAGQVEAPLVPQGQVGGCVECGHTVASHFKALDDGTAQFIGCLKGTPETVYILVAARGGMSALSSNGTEAPTSPEVARQGRAFRRARYRSTLHHKAKPALVVVDDAPLSEARREVLEAVHASSKAGVRSKDIRKRTKRSHGAVQQTLHWLRAHGLVVAEEDAS